MSGYRSAIKEYYNSKGISFSADVDLMLSDFLGGYARKIAIQKTNKTFITKHMSPSRILANLQRNLQAVKNTIKIIFCENKTI